MININRFIKKIRESRLFSTITIVLQFSETLKKDLDLIVEMRDQEDRKFSREIFITLKLIAVNFHLLSDL